MSDAPAAEVYQLKISLRCVTPMVWRRVLVRSDFTLYGLHRAIQIAFGWEDYHLHECERPPA
ncbi:MAG: plasmid pRiA4b ORF-3 family protein [Gemmatimonadales bacterium]